MRKPRRQAAARLGADGERSNDIAADALNVVRSRLWRSAPALPRRLHPSNARAHASSVAQSLRRLSAHNCSAEPLRGARQRECAADVLMTASGRQARCADVSVCADGRQVEAQPSRKVACLIESRSRCLEGEAGRPRQSRPSAGRRREPASRPPAGASDRRPSAERGTIDRRPVARHRARGSTIRRRGGSGHRARGTLIAPGGQRVTAAVTERRRERRIDCQQSAHGAFGRASSGAAGGGASRTERSVENRSHASPYRCASPQRSADAEQLCGLRLVPRTREGR